MNNPPKEKILFFKATMRDWFRVKRLAQKDDTTMSATVRKAVLQYLRRRGIDK